MAVTLNSGERPKVQGQELGFYSGYSKKQREAIIQSSLLVNLSLLQYILQSQFWGPSTTLSRMNSSFSSTSALTSSLGEWLGTPEGRLWGHQALGSGGTSQKKRHKEARGRGL